MLLGFLVVLLSAQSSLGCTEESCLVATPPSSEERCTNLVWQASSRAHRAPGKGGGRLCDEAMVEQLEKSTGLQCPQDVHDFVYKHGHWWNAWGYHWYNAHGVLAAPNSLNNPSWRRWWNGRRTMSRWPWKNSPKKTLQEKMCTLKDQTDEVKKCTDDLVKKIKKLLGLFQNLLFSLLFVIMKQQLNFCSCSFHQIHLRWRQVHWPWIFHCWTNQKRPKFVVGLKGIGSDMCAPVVLSSFAGSQILWKSQWRSWRAIDRKDMVLSPHGFELHDVLPW